MITARHPQMNFARKNTANTRHLLNTILCLTVSTPGLSLSGCHHAAAEHEPEHGPVLVRCEQVSQVAMQDVRVLHGSLQIAPERLARVAAQVAGRVLRLEVREGAVVTAGQLLAHVETSTLRERAQTLSGELVGARATLSNAQALIARLEPLVSAGIVARQELEDARTRAAVARAALAPLQGSAQLNSQDVRRASLRSPIDGVVLRVLRGVGELVDGTAGTPVVEIGDPRALEFVANATAADLSVARAQQRATLRLASFGSDALDARVDRVGDGVDPTTGIGVIRLTLDRSSLDRWPIGTTGEASLVVGTHAGALAVPLTALREREADRAEVLLCLDGHAAVRAVRVGLTHDAMIEIADGLTRGDRVVSERAVGIEDGAEIRESTAENPATQSAETPSAHRGDGSAPRSQDAR
jgi:RND family efflux transporter MFP subunit